MTPDAEKRIRGKKQFTSSLWEPTWKL